jgi:aminomethyltransferase
VDKRTPLFAEHVKAGARMVPFGGFQMPVQYTGIVDEHVTVRQAMGLFDLSHMGEFRVRGEQALTAVDSLVTNDIAGLDEGQIRYTPMCFPAGGIVDDILVYRFPDHVKLVVNAANIEKDLTWVKDHVPPGVQVDDESDSVALLALQGPRADELLQTLTTLDLTAIPYYHFDSGQVAGVQAVVSRTGYTGEDGFELYVQPEYAARLWQSLLERGSPDGLKPIGLGARDTLRLEACYLLYGNDIDQTTSPLEAGLGWTVKLDHDFVGRTTLEQQKTAGVARRLVAIEMLDRSIPRPHCDISCAGSRVGELTSGSFSPTFQRGIGLGYVPTDGAKVGTDVQIDIRGELHPARVVRKPIYKREE